MRLGFLVLMVSVFSAMSFATEPEPQHLLECKVKKVFADDYENINDFTFKDYPYLVVKPTAKGWLVSVGAMVYGEDEEILTPEQIRSTWISPTHLSFNADSEYEKWFIEVNLSKQEATFWFYENDISAEPSKVAVFACDLSAKK